jgi:hypothetical protein
MADEAPELLPCPFCGGPAKIVMSFPGCEPCALVRRDAASWNHRADLVAAQVREAVIDALRGVVAWHEARAVAAASPDVRAAHRVSASRIRVMAARLDAQSKETAE